MNISPYYDELRMTEGVLNNEHRSLIGGMWDEIGRLQLEFLRTNGLSPHHKVLDIGCGTMRFGVHAVEYLNEGNYWGTDLNKSFLEAGYDREIVPLGLASKLPPSNLKVDTEFDFTGIPTNFDYAIAMSVFTHLPLNHIRLCLAKLASHLTEPCTFFFTIFTPPNEDGLNHEHKQTSEISTYPHKDPYHYLLRDIKYAAVGLPVSINFLGNWHHPRNQKMVRADFHKAGKAGLIGKFRSLLVSDRSLTR